MPQEPHAVERNIGHHLSFGKLFTNWNELSDNPAWWVGGQKKNTHTHRKCVRTMQSAGNNFLFTCVFPVWCHQQLLAALSVWRFGVKLCQPACLPAWPASWRVNCEQIVMGRSSYCFANTNKNGMKRFEATNLHGEVYYFPWKKKCRGNCCAGVVRASDEAIVGQVATVFYRNFFPLTMLCDRRTKKHNLNFAGFWLPRFRDMWEGTVRATAFSINVVTSFGLFLLPNQSSAGNWRPQNL